MTINEHLGPKDLLYKEVIDAEGNSLGKIVNITQNGAGFFETFGVEMCESAAIRMNGNKANAGGHLFLKVDIIAQVDRIIRIKRTIDELKALNGW